MRTSPPKRSPTDVRTVVVVLVVLSAVGLVGAGAAAGVTAGGDGEPGATAASAVDDAQARDHDPNVSVWTAPQDARLTNESAIEVARDAGRLTPTDTVAPGDRLVLRLTADGIATDFRNADGANDTERLRSLFGGDRYDLTVRQTYDTVYVEREPKTLGLLEPAVLTVVPVGTDSVYLVYDTDALESVYGGVFDGRVYGNESDDELDGGEAYNVTVRTGDGVATTTVAVVDRTIGGPVAGDDIYGVPGERTTVSVPTTLAPGTEVAISLTIEGQERRTVTAVAGPNRSLRVPVDARNLTGDADGVATLTDHYDGRYADEDDDLRVPVRVRSERGVVDRAEAARRSNAVRFRTGVNLSHPGFVAVRNAEGDTLHVFGPFDAGNSVSANVFLELDRDPGDEVRFVAVRDVDQDGVYDATDERFAAGDPVRTATVADARPETTTTTDAPTTAPTGSATAAPTTGGSETTTATTVGTAGGTTAGGGAATDGEDTPATDGETGDDGPVPAVGVVGTLAAVLATLAIGRRRR